MPFLSVATDMKWMKKILIVIIVTFVMGAGMVLAIRNPQMVTIDLWGWQTIERTVAAWSLMMVAFGILIGVGLALALIMKLQSQLYMIKRKMTQSQSAANSQEHKK